MKRDKRPQASSLAENAFRHYGAQLHRFLLRRLRRAADAEDLAQEVFMRLSRIENESLIEKPRSYLFGIAAHVVSEFRIRNEHLDSCLTFDDAVVEHEAEHPHEMPPDALAEQLDVQRQLRRALDRLPALHRTVFVLHKRDGYSYAEIAEQLLIPQRKVESCLAEAKLKFRQMKWDR